ncbi:MAG: hypothetical protein OEZ51_11810 [Nitrospinota bacterium]|nr:hypothetical protein [Nitrospinota bacterium]
MLFARTQIAPANHNTSKKSWAPAFMGLSIIFVLGIVSSGCVVHHKGHGYKHGHGHGHHKSHIKIKPEVGVSVSPMIVIDD